MPHANNLQTSDCSASRKLDSIPRVPLAVMRCDGLLGQAHYAAVATFESKEGVVSSPSER